MFPSVTSHNCGIAACLFLWQDWRTKKKTLHFKLEIMFAGPIYFHFLSLDPPLLTLKLALESQNDESSSINSIEDTAIVERCSTNSSVMLKPVKRLKREEGKDMFRFGIVLFK